MQTMVFINPLKPGKLKDYKAFIAQNTGPRKAEYIDLLKRYGLKTAHAYYQRLDNKEYVVVVHQVEDNAGALLANWSKSTHPYDQWFNQQLLNLHDFESFESNGQPEMILDFDAAKQ